MDLRPTEEQQQAIDLFGTGESLAINALAGSGKTSCLAMIADANPRKQMRYMAYNRALVQDSAAAFGQNVECSTAHSLAFRVTGKPFAHRLNGPRVKAYQIARSLRIGPIVVEVEGHKRVLQPEYLASLAMVSVGKFCNSADPEIGTQHVPYIDGIDMPTDSGARTYRNNESVRHELLPALGRAWADMMNPTGQCKYQHDCYLKNFALEGHQIAADVLLVDEAQDLNGCMLQIVQNQKNTQLVLVGDPYQTLYEWRGCRDALAEIDVTHRTPLTVSFRFGPAIAEVANLILERLGSPNMLIGGGPADSSVGPIEGLPHSTLCRTNATSVREVLQFQADGRAVHLVGGGKEIASFARGAQELMTQKHTRHPELACFDSWASVQAYVQDDPQGDELRLLVRLVDEFGVDTILRALDGSVTEEKAEVIVSTCHRSKGRTFSTTKIAGDFPDEIDDDAEWRLCYVSATRPRHQLDVESCGPIRLLVDGAKRTPTPDPQPSQAALL